MKIRRRISAACRDLDHRACHVKDCICICHQRKILGLEAFNGSKKA